MAVQRKALGRGLNALLGAPEAEVERLKDVDISRILPNSQQPRKHFDEEALDELTKSIRIHGVIQPLVLQPLADDFYQLIAGERRWRAAQRAGLQTVPAIIRDAGAHASLELALIENIQRENLNPIEEAQAYERLIAEFGQTQEEVARQVGKGRATVANMLRLLRLPPEVQGWIAEGKLSAGHAKALLSLSSPDAILETARKIIQGNYSVRQAELLAARHGKDLAPKEPVDSARTVDPNVAAAIRTLEQAVGTKVVIQESGGQGRIELHFFSFEEMNRLYEGLLRAKF